jgi:acid phosphatase family membrane protein YuiD
MIELKKGLIELLTNRVLICAVFAWIFAQLLKIFTSPKYRQDMSLLRFIVGSGGMPSSHAATVCATAFSCGILYGYDSGIFAVAAVLAVVVMRDAAGIRREAGKQAEIINQISEELNKKKKKPTFEDTLKVLLGHTPLQVLCGALLGVMIAFFCQHWLFLKIYP